MVWIRDERAPITGLLGWTSEWCVVCSPPAYRTAASEALVAMACTLLVQLTILRMCHF